MWTPDKVHTGGVSWVHACLSARRAGARREKEPWQPAALGPQFDFLQQEPLSRTRGGESLQKQLLHRNRTAVLDGRLPAGSCLPGSRSLAKGLGVSRNTVTLMYDVLGTKGYIELSRQGTRVAALTRPESGSHARQAPAPPTLSQRSDRIHRPLPARADSLAFTPGGAALAQFPLAAWGRSSKAERACWATARPRENRR